MTICGYTGRIFNYIKIAQPEPKEQQKKSDSAVQSGLSAFFKQNKEINKTNTLKGITNKMQFGKRLTRDEMEFLKIHSPELYAKAAKIEKERDEHRSALRNCKTKEEAQHFHIVRAFQPGMDVEVKLALFDEFTEFVKSNEFGELPNEHEFKDENENEDKNENQNKRKFKNIRLIKDAYLYFPQNANIDVCSDVPQN